MKLGRWLNKREREDELEESQGREATIRDDQKTERKLTVNLRMVSPPNQYLWQPTLQTLPPWQEIQLLNIQDWDGDLKEENSLYPLNIAKQEDRGKFLMSKESNGPATTINVTESQHLSTNY